MAYWEDQEERRVGARGAGNVPIAMLPASWDGHRAARLVVRGRGDIGLAAIAYSCLLTDAEKAEAARRIAALWSLAAASGWSTEQIEGMAQAAGAN